MKNKKKKKKQVNKITVVQVQKGNRINKGTAMFS